MFRDRTNLFLSYRRTIPRDPIPVDFNEEEGLIGNRKPRFQDATNTMELQPMAPSIFDISLGLDANLNVIANKTSQLNSLYRKLLITSSSEKPDMERKIEDLNYEITKHFESNYVMVKKYDFLQHNHQRLGLNYSTNEVNMLENLKKNYALKIQHHLVQFRNLQNNYIKFLRHDDYDDLNDNGSQTFLVQEEEEQNTKSIEDYSRHVIQTQQTQQTQQNPSNDQYLNQRDREISKLAMGILEISTMFKEMEGLVVEQGTILDRIDYNITNTAQDVKESNTQLLSAKTYQQRTTKCKIIFLLTLVVFALLIVVVMKPSGGSVGAPNKETSKETPQRPGPPEKAPEGSDT